MPYRAGSRLPGEGASRLGHLEVVQSPLVRRFCADFDDPEPGSCPTTVAWQTLPRNGDKLGIVFATDGSLQTIESRRPPHKAIAFVKTALLKIDHRALSRLDPQSPNPFVLRDVMRRAALYHATVFPLRHVGVPGRTLYDAVREAIYESVKDPGMHGALGGAMMETLKWVAYEKWNSNAAPQIEPFGCPHCHENVATLSYDNERGTCPGCGGEIFITDLFGLHLSMQEEYAPNQVATDYMAISETLMILSPIRYYWDHNRQVLNRTIMVKDGPLSLRATLSKLAAPIRRFLAHAKEQGVEIALVGQEKSGAFYDHLQLIGQSAPSGTVFVPDNDYIRKEIQHSNLVGVYGADTNYGAKVFVKYDDYHQLVLNVPTGERGEHVLDPSIEHLIAFENIVASLPSLLSHRYEGGLLPIELAHGIASLSTYPSAKVLELFAEEMRG